MIYWIGMMFTWGLFCDADKPPKGFSEWLLVSFAIMVWPLTLGLIVKNRFLEDDK